MPGRPEGRPQGRGQEKPGGADRQPRRSKGGLFSAVPLPAASGTWVLGTPGGLSGESWGPARPGRGVETAGQSLGKLPGPMGRGEARGPPFGQLVTGRPERARHGGCRAASPPRGGTRKRSRHWLRWTGRRLGSAWLGRGPRTGCPHPQRELVAQRGWRDKLPVFCQGNRIFHNDNDTSSQKFGVGERENWWFSLGRAPHPCPACPLASGRPGG